MIIRHDPDEFEAKKEGNGYVLRRRSERKIAEIKRKKRIKKLKEEIIRGKIAEKILKEEEK